MLYATMRYQLCYTIGYKLCHDDLASGVVLELTIPDNGRLFYMVSIFDAIKASRLTVGCF